MIGTIVLTVFLFVTALYFVSLYLRDASIIDIFWGIGFILIAAQSLYISFHNNLDMSLPKFVASGLVLLWGVRLSAHIALRHNNEDPRYAQWRSEWGSFYFVRSYFQIFLLQGALMIAISSVVWLVNLSRITSYSSNMLWTGVGVWAAGFLIEAIADGQLAAFRSHAGNRGKLLMSGLWAASRHPNYFGEAVQWFGLFVVGLSAASVSWHYLIIGPLVILFLLRFVSGVPLLESRMRKNPQYAHYAARTNTFLPWFPR